MIIHAVFVYNMHEHVHQYNIATKFYNKILITLFQRNNNGMMILHTFSTSNATVIKQNLGLSMQTSL